MEKAEVVKAKVSVIGTKGEAVGESEPQEEETQIWEIKDKQEGSS